MPITEEPDHCFCCSIKTGCFVAAFYTIIESTVLAVFGVISLAGNDSPDVAIHKSLIYFWMVPTAWAITSIMGALVLICIVKKESSKGMTTYIGGEIISLLIYNGLGIYLLTLLLKGSFKYHPLFTLATADNLRSWYIGAICFFFIDGFLKVSAVGCVYKEYTRRRAQERDPAEQRLISTTVQVVEDGY